MADKKKIAIIGCSHSYYLQCNQNWTTMFPDGIEIHNFSLAGHGVMYFDYVLKYIIANKLHFDAVIIQLTGNTRWQFPVTGTCSDDLKVETISDNYYNYWIDYAHATISQIIPHEEIMKNELFSDARFYNSGMLIHEEDLTKSQFHEDNINITANETWITEYYKLFVDTLHLYESSLENIFYWRFGLEVINNIGQDIKPALDVVIDQTHLYDELDDVVDDSLHLTPLGYRILFDEYIMKSKIGDWVKENT